MKKKDWKSLLISKAEEDGAKCLKIYGKNIDDCDKIQRQDTCTAVCNCGEDFSKNIRQIVEISGLFCDKCTTINYLKKVKKTNLERRGVEYPFQSQEVKDKFKETSLKKYGVESPNQSQEVKNKKKETCLLNFGVENPLQSQEVRDKFKETNLKRYGVENPSQSQEVKDKKKETSLLNFGVEHPLQSQEVRDKGKATNFEKYGVEYPMQNREIFEKVQKNRFKLKEYIFASGETIHCQGDEPWALEELEELHGYTYDDYTNKTSFWYTHDEIPHRYYTDIEYLRKNKIIEVKSNWTFENEICINFLKANCVLKEGYDFEFWIYKDRKSVKIVIDRSRFELNNEIKHRRRGKGNLGSPNIGGARGTWVPP